MNRLVGVPIEDQETKEQSSYFKDHALNYNKQGYSTIPEKPLAKQPCIKGWTDFTFRIPTIGELDSWSTMYPEAGLSVLTGKVSGIVALDIDEVRPEILAIIMPILPPSPVVKVGAKGETRFYRYKGESTDNLKFNGSMVIEILSTGKKTHLPPSIHPSGVSYKWTSDKTLLDIDRSELPILPPAILSHIGSLLRSKFPHLVTTGTKTICGRNDALSSLCGSLIQDGKSVDEVLKALINHDLVNNEPPLFTDPEENRHTEPYTNALQFYSNHLSSVNTRRYRTNKEYEIPMIASSINAEVAREVLLKKEQSKGRVKRLNNPESQLALNAKKTLNCNSCLRCGKVKRGAKQCIK